MKNIYEPLLMEFLSYILDHFDVHISTTCAFSGMEYAIKHAIAHDVASKYDNLSVPDMSEQAIYEDIELFIPPKYQKQLDEYDNYGQLYVQKENKIIPLPFYARDENSMRQAQTLEDINDFINDLPIEADVPIDSIHMIHCYPEYYVDLAKDIQVQRISGYLAENNQKMLQTLLCPDFPKEKDVPEEDIER